MTSKETLRLIKTAHDSKHIDYKKLGARSQDEQQCALYLYAMAITGDDSRTDLETFTNSDRLVHWLSKRAFTIDSGTHQGVYLSLFQIICAHGHLTLLNAVESCLKKIATSTPKAHGLFRYTPSASNLLAKLISQDHYAAFLSAEIHQDITIMCWLADRLPQHAIDAMLWSNDYTVFRKSLTIENCALLAFHWQYANIELIRKFKQIMIRSNKGHLIEHLERARNDFLLAHICPNTAEIPTPKQSNTPLTSINKEAQSESYLEFDSDGFVTIPLN